MVFTGLCECKDGYRGGVFLPCFSDQGAKAIDALKKAASEAQEKVQTQLARCREDGDPAQRFPCPDSVIVPSPNRNQCKPRLLDCFDGNASLGRSFLALLNCSAGQKPCPSVGCVDEKVDCAPAVGRCPEDRPHRCRLDMLCVASKSACNASAPDPCPGQTGCPDGVTCAANRSACARALSWNGPPPGQAECPQRRGAFADSPSECAEITGCPNGTKGRAGLRTVSDFVAQTLRAGAAAAAEAAVARGDNRTGAVFRVRKGGFRGVDNSTAGDGVNFTVTPVPDSARDNGPFRDLVQGQRLWSPLITINPSSQVVPEAGGVALELCVDDDAVTNASVCAALLASLQMVAVDDVYDPSLVPAPVGPCSMGTGGACSCGCVVNITHFSTYGVSLSGGVAAATDAGSATATAASGDTLVATATNASSTGNTTASNTAGVAGSSAPTTPSPATAPTTSESTAATSTTASATPTTTTPSTMGSGGSRSGGGRWPASSVLLVAAGVGLASLRCGAGRLG